MITSPESEERFVALLLANPNRISQFLVTLVLGGSCTSLSPVIRASRLGARVMIVERSASAAK
jgi:hypothetical protein